MRIGSGAHTYEWIENWAVVPDTESHRSNGRTHGVVVSRSGDVLVFCQANPAVLVFGPDGGLKASWGDRFGGAHGMTLVEEDGTEFLWLTDQDSREVVKTTLTGETVQTLAQAPHPIYETAHYSPTWVAVNETRLGGNGDIWVTDGYGSNHLHRYTAAGDYVASINGSEGETGPFACPHGIWMDHRRGEPELYIADRGNHRVQVYDAAGSYRRSFGSEFLTSPDGFVSQGGLLYVPELFCRITICDAEDQLVCSLGSHEPIREVPGWPNLRDRLEPGKFNSPHGLAVGPDGSVYVVEWIVGGRITKLKPV